LVNLSLCMKRYLLFTGEIYYPAQGWNNFRRDSDNKDALVTLAQKLADIKAASPDGFWAHIVDTTTKEIIWNI
jgi:hypothetical protein